MKLQFRKIIILLFIAIMSFFVDNGSVYGASSELTFKPGTVRLYGSTYLGEGSDNNVWLKQSVDGHYGYCIEIHKNWFETGNRTYKLVDESDSRIAYVLENGFPNKSITGDDNKDYYITGLAVWYLISPNDYWFSRMSMENGTYNGISSDTVIEANKLVTAAKSHTSYVEPSIESFKNSDSAFKLSSDKKYYITDKAIGINTKGNVGNYTVTLSGEPNGTVVTDTNGAVKNSFSPNDSFLIKVPVSSISKLSNTIVVSVRTSGSIYKAYNYHYDSSEYELQSVTVGFSESKSVDRNMSLPLNVVTGVEISKVDATTGNELPGATLVLKDSKGIEVAKWVSESTPHKINGLAFGKYTLTETIAPKGYKKSSETIEFEIKPDEPIVKKIMKNSPNIVEISKQDATTGKELPGASLVLKDSKGNTKDEWKWISGNKPYVLKLEPGKYTLTETIAPKGYKKSSETVEFTVESDGTVKKPVVMKNSPNTVEISKQDATTGKELPGATLVLKDSKGNTKDEWKWISGNKPHVLRLEPGKYTLTETIAPKGYKKSSETVEFTVESDGTVKKPVVMKNEPIEPEQVPTGDALIYVAWLAGLGAIGYSIYYYRNLKKKN